jgi:branched-chain amino acid transport system ATP-binding protein
MTVAHRTPAQSTGQRSTLEVRALNAGYGRMTVLHDVSLRLAPGESLGIFGPNGAGKSTLLGAMVGSVPASRGDIVLGDKSLARVPSYRRAAMGIGLVPEGRQIIDSLSVRANLEVTIFSRGRLRLDREHRARIDEMFDLFPRLRERQRHMGVQLSGGERQMLAMARALMSRPAVLLLDEPSQGLSPSTLRELVDALRNLRGERSMVVVEQEPTLLEALSDRIMRMRMGRLEER